jgi:magnesium and cobalt transporter
MRKPFFIPETKKIVHLLKEFKDNKMKIAIVVDEFGGVSGIVTLMDILEEIIGDIKDEDSMEEEIKIINLPDGSFLLDSRTPIEDIRKELNLEIEDGPYDTIGGFVIKEFGRLPEKGEKIKINNFDIIINEIYEKGIKNLIIKRGLNEDQS